MKHFDAIKWAQHLDKNFTLIVNDFRAISETCKQLGLNNLALEFHNQAENHMTMQIVISRVLSDEFRKSATSGRDFQPPIVLDKFVPTLVINPSIHPNTP